MDLLSSRPFWPIRDGLPATFPPLDRDTECDVVVIGSGITGSVIAWQLALARFEVVVLDRREAAHGSTAGNTGLVLYELDVMLHLLARRMGQDSALAAYRRCERAVASLDAIVRSGRIDCEFEARPSLYLAAKSAHVARLRREFEARRAAGLDVEWWPQSRIESASSLPHAAAILSRPAATIDPYRFSYGMLLAAQVAGARIHDRTAATRRAYRRNGVDLFTSRGRRVRARHLVVANGYEAEATFTHRTGTLNSTYALVSEPIADGRFRGWPGARCLMWDTADPYLYLRTTSDRRIMIGGYDEPFRNARLRDAMLPVKTAALVRRLRQLFPDIPIEVATAWSGTFGASADGLPYIGQHPSRPHTWFALGFGGNGITFSLIAGEIIRAGILGEQDPDAKLFGFDRSFAVIRG